MKRLLANIDERVTELNQLANAMIQTHNELGETVYQARILELTLVKKQILEEQERIIRELEKCPGWNMNDKNEMAVSLSGGVIIPVGSAIKIVKGEES